MITGRDDGLFHDAEDVEVECEKPPPMEIVTEEAFFLLLEDIYMRVRENSDTLDKCALHLRNCHFESETQIRLLFQALESKGLQCLVQLQMSGNVRFDIAALQNAATDVGRVFKRIWWVQLNVVPNNIDEAYENVVKKMFDAGCGCQRMDKVEIRHWEVQCCEEFGTAPIRRIGLPTDDKYGEGVGNLSGVIEAVLKCRMLKQISIDCIKLTKREFDILRHAFVHSPHKDLRKLAVTRCGLSSENMIKLWVAVSKSEFMNSLAAVDMSENGPCKPSEMLGVLEKIEENRCVLTYKENIVFLNLSGWQRVDSSSPLGRESWCECKPDMPLFGCLEHKKYMLYNHRVNGLVGFIPESPERRKYFRGGYCPSSDLDESDKRILGTKGAGVEC